MVEWQDVAGLSRDFQIISARNIGNKIYVLTCIHRYDYNTGGYDRSNAVLSIEIPKDMRR